MGIGSMNAFYQRHDENNVAVPNPGSTADNTDPGSGWSNLNYLNFNADKIYIDDNGDPRTPDPYQARNDDNTPRTPGTYQRYDDQDPPQPVADKPPIPNS